MREDGCHRAGVRHTMAQGAWWPSTLTADTLLPAAPMLYQSAMLALTNSPPRAPTLVCRDCRLQRLLQGLKHQVEDVQGTAIEVPVGEQHNEPCVHQGVAARTTA